MRLRGLRMSLAILAIICIGLAVYVNEAQSIYDWWRLRNYQAPADIVTLADQTTMTNLGKHLFYINHPTLEVRGQFNTDCPNNGGEQTIILGCYHGVENGIFLYIVSDPTLNGVEQVTAAHEMLHAAYDRLSSSVRNQVDSELENYYQNDLHDTRIQSEIANYKRTEPNDVENEMHSVFATEVSNLPVSLETYYKQYFTNRQVIVNFTNQYQAKFTADQTQIQQFDQQLTSLKNEIATNESTLNALGATINQQKTTLNNELSSGNIAAYNNGVSNFNSQVDQYNILISTTKNEISQYNLMIQERNNIATQYNQLSSELNSNLPSTASR